MDHRIEKTKRSIYNAFIEIRSKKPLEKVTVKALCDKAQINKSTFYVYYEDVYDLSDKLEREIVENIIYSIDSPEDIIDNPEVFTRKLYLAYSSQSALISTVFSGTRSERLPCKIEEALKEMIFSKHPELSDSPETAVLITYSVYGGHFAYIKNKSCDEDSIINCISKTSEKIMR